MVLSARRGSALAGAALAVAAAATAGCGASDSPGAAPAQLVATTSILADITSQVACGKPVRAVLPAGADPHTYEPSLSDRQLLEDAAAVIANGAALEDRLADLLTTVAAEGTNVVELSTHVDLLPLADTDHAAGEQGVATADDGHGHTLAGDPHYWHDPTRVAGVLDMVASAVMAAGFDAAAVRRCTDEFRTRLEALDAEITAQLAALPEQRRVLVTNHAAFGYFADRYALEVVGTVIPSASTLAEPGSAELAELQSIIEERDVPAIFVESGSSAVDAIALAERAGVAVIELYSDTLSLEGPGSTYLGMLRANAAAIAAALR